MYRPEGIGQVIWKFAKSSKEVTMENLKEVISEYSGIVPDMLSDYSVYEVVFETVGQAIEAGVIRAHMFRDFANAIVPSPFFRNYQAIEVLTELTMIQCMINMIRYVQVIDGDTILIDLD
jgi:hypothetical protein